DPCGFMSSLDQLTANAAALPALVDSQVGEICAEMEIRNRAGNADEQAARTGSHDHVSVHEHAADRFWLLDRPPLGQGRALKQTDELLSVELRVGLESV